MTGFLKLAKARFSSRKYLSKPVEEEKLLQVLEAARIAPSAANKQPCIYYVIRNKDKKDLIAQAYHRDWLKNASVIIVACADHNKAWIRSDQKDHCDIDVAIAIDHMTLQATELGLATCWICNFDPEKCRNILQLTENIEPIVILPLAYPADSADINRHDTIRRKLDEIVKWEF
jgi:nitroreductase